MMLAIAGTAANEVWRMAGVWLSRGADPAGPFMVWVKDISTALVAALIARLLVFPTGELAAVPGLVRSLGFAAGAVVYFLSRKNLAIGLASAEAVFLIANWAFTG
jgi:hypothetical protein